MYVQIQTLALFFLFATSNWTGNIRGVKEGIIHKRYVSVCQDRNDVQYITRLLKSS